MGLEIAIQTAALAEWPTIAATLVSLNAPPTIRMIDGLPAFPDEVPSEDWKELRISFAGSMITLGRTVTGYRVVSWGTADPQLDATRNRLAYAVAIATSGTVPLRDHMMSADAFGREVGVLPQAT